LPGLPAWYPQLTCKCLELVNQPTRHEPTDARKMQSWPWRIINFGSTALTLSSGPSTYISTPYFAATDSPPSQMSRNGHSWHHRGRSTSGRQIRRSGRKRGPSSLLSEYILQWSTATFHAFRLPMIVLPWRISNRMNTPKSLVCASFSTFKLEPLPLILCTVSKWDKKSLGGTFTSWQTSVTLQLHKTFLKDIVTQGSDR